MLDIFDYMDCEGCPSYSRREACLTADTYYSEPGEAECSEENFGEDHICDRMMWRLEEGVRDGDFDSVCVWDKEGTRIDGYLATGEYLVEAQEKGDAPEGYNYSAAPYWFVPDDQDYAPKPFYALIDVYYKFFEP